MPSQRAYTQVVPSYISSTTKRGLMVRSITSLDRQVIVFGICIGATRISYIVASVVKLSAERMNGSDEWSGNELVSSLTFISAGASAR
jgi:anthranilate/para-aminobenzoate synthase component II